MPMVALIPVGSQSSLRLELPAKHFSGSAGSQRVFLDLPIALEYEVYPHSLTDRQSQCWYEPQMDTGCTEDAEPLQPDAIQC